MDYSSNLNVVSIIPARGGSKGIPNKNIVEICGHPLISWSIKQSLSAKLIKSTWVTSDDQKILDISKSYGSNVIKRPKNIASDNCSSELAWIHSLDHINSLGIRPDLVVGMQCTSPIRESKDLDLAINSFIENKYDSLLSTVEIEDYFAWGIDENAICYPINYDIKKRKPRQKIKKTYLENGSFYIFKPDLLKKSNNRLGGKIGMYIMKKHKAFQIDNQDDIRICSAIIKEYGMIQ